MLVPPPGLIEDELIDQLTRSWGLSVAGSVAYLPVGFGSHHWEAVDDSGAHWFVTVDDLTARRETADEPLADVLRRLSGSLGAARSLYNAGFDFVVAPVPTLDSGALLPVGERFSAAVYPMVKGKSFERGEFKDPDQLAAVLDMLVVTHTTPVRTQEEVPVDDLAIQMRGGLEAALADGVDVPDRGPFSRPAALLITEHTAAVRACLARYDALAEQAREESGEHVGVLTHGEPHPGNTMLTDDGWKLIDWDTAAIAPPERDLWDLDTGDGWALDAYRDATGAAPRPSMMELYRLRWDLTDLALYACEFRREHSGDANDIRRWENTGEVLARLNSAAGRLRA